MLDKGFIDVFALSVQDLAAKKVSPELNVEKVECGMRQGDKVGISTGGELTRSKDNGILSTFPEDADLMNKLRNMVKHFE